MLLESNEMIATTRLAISNFLVGISLIVLLTALVHGDENKIYGTVPPVETILLLIAWYWLAGNEISQVSCVMIEQINPPSTWYSCQKVKALLYPTNDGNKKSALFLGQTFQVVAMTFLIAQILSFQKLTMFRFMTLLTASGLMGVLVTSTIFQLFPSTLATEFPAYMLEYFPGIAVMIRLSLLIEASGIANAVYVILSFVAPDPNDKYWSTIIDATKTIVSIIVLNACFFYCIVHSCTSNDLNLIGGLLLVSFMAVIFLLEGSKVAVLQLMTKYSSSSSTNNNSSSSDMNAINTGSEIDKMIDIDVEEVAANADSNSINQIYELSSIIPLLKEDGLDRFLIGRQLLVVPVSFFIASLCSGSATIPAIFLVATLAQLLPQIIAGRNPSFFLKHATLMELVIRATHFMEMGGVADISLMLKKYAIDIITGKNINQSNGSSSSSSGNVSGDHITTTTTTKSNVMNEWDHKYNSGNAGMGTYEEYQESSPLHVQI